MDAVSYFDAVLFPFAAAASIVRRIRGWDELPRYDVRTPSPLANRLLTGILASEAPLVGRWSPPAGDSVLAIARRP